MNDPDHIWNKLIQTVKSTQNSSITDAPLGFSTRILTTLISPQKQESWDIVLTFYGRKSIAVLAVVLFVCILHFLITSPETPLWDQVFFNAGLPL
jgi:hypothetical protein